MCGVSIGIDIISKGKDKVPTEKIIKYEIKILSTRAVNPSFEKNLDKIIRKGFDSGLGKSLLNGTTFIELNQLKV